MTFHDHPDARSIADATGFEVVRMSIVLPRSDHALRNGRNGPNRPVRRLRGHELGIATRPIVQCRSM